MYRTHTLRLRPNQAQIAAFEDILRDSAETYNAALQERIEAWKLDRKFISLYDQMAELTELRKDERFQGIACEIQREPLRRVDRAFKAFFRRCKAGTKPGFPRFRSRQRCDSFTFPIDKRCKLAVRERSIHVPNVGDIRMRGWRSIEGIAKQATVKRIGNKWQVSICCDIGPEPDKCAVERPIGIDVGLTALVALSNGTEIDNPRWTKQRAERIANANRLLARKKRGSKNRLKAREALRRAHQSASNARSNYIHHVSKWLVANYDLIAHEDLKIANMVRGHFAKSINDAAWGQLLFQLTYKAESAGKHIVTVNPRFTSQVCSGCGQVAKKELSERQHVCDCGLTLGRDHNAALNILRFGMSLAGLPSPSECPPWLNR